MSRSKVVEVDSLITDQTWTTTMDTTTILELHLINQEITIKTINHLVLHPKTQRWSLFGTFTSTVMKMNWDCYSRRTSFRLWILLCSRTKRLARTKAKAFVNLRLSKRHSMLCRIWVGSSMRADPSSSRSILRTKLSTIVDHLVTLTTKLNRDRPEITTLIQEHLVVINPITRAATNSTTTALITRVDLERIEMPIQWNSEVEVETSTTATWVVKEILNRNQDHQWEEEAKPCPDIETSESICTAIKSCRLIWWLILACERVSHQ